jgi:hypothetical protein
VRSLFFISPRTGHGNSRVLEMLPAFSCISCARAFRAGDNSSIFISGPVEAGERNSCPISTGCLFCNRYAVQTIPIRIWDERERLVTASPVMKRAWAPAGGNNYPESGLVKPPRLDTRALSPAECSEERRRSA